MPNYKESSVTGSVWQRAYQVFIDNPYGGVPSITFNEEEVIDVGTTNVRRHLYALTELMSDPNTQFNIINPTDGSIIGASNYQEVYVLLASLYTHLATIRDQASQ